MGKKLVIAGADFYYNGWNDNLTWFVSYSTNALKGDTAFANSNKFYVVPSEVSRLGLIGKTVNVVRLYAASAGTISIGTVDPNNNTVGDNYTYSVVAGVNVIRLTSPVTFSSTCSIWISGQGRCKYWAANMDTDYGWLFRNTTGSSVGVARIPCAFGFAIE